MKKLTDIKAYTDFVDARDRVLEVLLLRARAEIADQLRGFKNKVKGEVVRTYPLLGEGTDHRTIMILRLMDQQLEQHAIHHAAKITKVWNKLRDMAYRLAYAGEWQAINNTGIGGKPIKKPQAVTKPTTLGSVQGRAHLGLSRLRKKVIDAVETSRILGSNIHDTLARVYRVFPRPSFVKKAQALPRTAAYKEADYDEEPDLDLSSILQFLTPAEYSDFMQWFKNTYTSEWRDPEIAGESLTTAEEGEVLYAWEVENEATEDFVQQVRDGENDSANANGITDFMWIAVIDKATDECCLQRDGLTTEEIEQKLDGEWQDDECDAATPPAHFNCRCRLAPLTDKLEKYVSDPDTIKSYESWMYPKDE